VSELLHALEQWAERSDFAGNLFDGGLRGHRTSGGSDLVIGAHNWAVVGIRHPAAGIAGPFSSRRHDEQVSWLVEHTPDQKLPISGPELRAFVGLAIWPSARLTGSDLETPPSFQPGFVMGAPLDLNRLAQVLELFPQEDEYRVAVGGLRGTRAGRFYVFGTGWFALLACRSPEHEPQRWPEDAPRLVPAEVS